ncbi:MAG: class I SAM-dependent methyltransferase [Lachnospiraceae bacterium]|nr:class I SAM-dependent methyltransferase [Lachnospiraceae bacterium]
MEEKELTRRVRDYWTERTPDFSIIRHNELKDEISRRWLQEMNVHLPKHAPLDILDVGTGTGYFAILLARAGHRVTGIDLTPSMIEEAKSTAQEQDVQVRFLPGDAQNTAFPDASFDAVVTRNLTWTLTDLEQAYREWHRLLKPGGILLNFDANYADNVRNNNQKASRVKPEDVYGHIGITPELSRENAEITLSMPASRHKRPEWDKTLAGRAGFASCGADPDAGQRILREKDLSDAPLFLFWAKKG